MEWFEQEQPDASTHRGHHDWYYGVLVQVIMTGIMVCYGELVQVIMTGIMVCYGVLVQVIMIGIMVCWYRSS